MTLVHEPGTVRKIHYERPRTINGYPVTYWGTVDEQIAEATAANARMTSRHDHRMMPLYTFIEDCGHPNPEDDARYDGVEDLLDEWVQRNLAGLTWRDGELYWKNRRRGEAAIPLYAEWRAAQDTWEDTHVGYVCLESLEGECCEECTEGDEDSGYEVGGCHLAERVRDAYDDFWANVSPDGYAERARQEAGAS